MTLFVFVLCSGYKLNDPGIPYPKRRSIIRAGRFLLTCLMCKAVAGGLGERSEPHIFC